MILDPADLEGGSVGGGRAILEILGGLLGKYFLGAKFLSFFDFWI